LFIAKKIDREEMHNYFMSGKNKNQTNYTGPMMCHENAKHRMNKSLH